MSFVPFVTSPVIALVFSESGLPGVGETNSLLDDLQMENIFSTLESTTEPDDDLLIEDISDEAPLNRVDVEEDEEDEDAFKKRGTVHLYPIKRDEVNGSEPYFACPVDHSSTVKIFGKPRSEIIAGNESFDETVWDKHEDLTDEVIPGLTVERGCSVEELSAES